MDHSFFKSRRIFFRPHNAVKPEFQGRGIANSLLLHIEKRTQELGGKELALDTAEGAFDLIEMYKRHGYKLVSTTKWPSTNYLSVIMTKEFFKASYQENITFQKAEPRDTNDILNLLQRISIWLDEKGVDQWKQFLDEKKGKAILERRFREGEVYKVLKNGTILGVFVIQWDDTFWHPMKKDNLACWIHTMGIDPSLKGNFIGKKILTYVEGVARSNDKKFVRLDCGATNKRLCEYYESNGFYDAGLKPWDEWMIRLYEKEL